MYVVICRTEHFVPSTEFCRKEGYEYCRDTDIFKAYYGHHSTFIVEIE